MGREKVVVLPYLFGSAVFGEIAVVKGVGKVAFARNYIGINPNRCAFGEAMIETAYKTAEIKAAKKCIYVSVCVFVCSKVWLATFHGYGVGRGKGFGGLQSQNGIAVAQA